MSTSERTTRDTVDHVARDVLDSLLEGCQVIGFDWTYLYVNEALIRQGKQSQEQLLGRTMMECYPGIEDTPMFSDLRRCMSERAHIRMENEFTFDDRTKGWFELRFVPVTAGVAILSLDITDRKRAEQALQQSEKTFRDLHMATPDAVLLVAEDGTILLANPAAEHIFGYRREDLGGLAIDELLPVRLRDAHVQHRQDYLANPRPHRVGERRELLGRRRDGTEFPVDISLGSLSFHGHPAALAVVSDITERRALEQARMRADAALRRADEGLRLLIDGVRDYAMIGMDPNGCITTWNAGAARLQGYSAEEIIGSDCQRFYPPEDVTAGKPALLLEAARAGGRAEDEGWRVRKNGARFWANVVVTSLFDPAGAHVGFAKITRDLTERRKLEDQIRQAQKLEAIGSLAGGVAHDFNNILSVILSYSAMLIDDLRPGDPMRKDLEEIKAAGGRATDLTRQLLAFGRQQILQPKPINLNEIVAAIEGMLRRLIGESVEFTFLPSSNLGVALLDPSQMDQVIINLVVNARDAMPHGGKLTIETANVTLDQEYAAHHIGVTPGPYVVIAVSDTGSGMDAETQKRIFEPFFTTKETGKGTGLGLSTVFGIVRQSGGHIWIYSEPGKGTVFKIYFPRSDEAVTVRGLIPVVLPRGGNETILLVEDDERVRSLASSILQRHGYHVLEAQNGGDALLICEQHGATIHLLLTDVVMPRMSGRQLAERLGSLRPMMKVLFMSGYTDNFIVHHGVLDSGVNFLQKPITPETLLRKIRAVFDRDD